MVLLVCLLIACMAQVSEIERNALLDLYNSTNGEQWDYSNAWLTGDPCLNGWYGVYCNANYTEVNAILLDQNNLNGTLPPSLSGINNLLAMFVCCLPLDCY